MRGLSMDRYTLGIDLGGTKVKTALVDSNGRISSSHKSATHADKDADNIIEDVLVCIEKCLGETSFEAHALGIGIAGQVDLNGTVLNSPNLGWRNVSLREKIEGRLRIPVFVTNDVRAATLGEWWHGSGKGVNDLIVLFVGTGIGGGVISNGRVISGCSNTGGELGHITIVRDGRKCHCPNEGCLEAYAGGWAIAERAQEAVRLKQDGSQLLVSLAGGIDNITAAHVGKAFHERNEFAIQLVEETGRFLASGVTGIVNAFNPCLLVFGGGVIEGIPELIHLVEETVRKKALEAATEKLKMSKAKLGGDAGVIGAATLAQKMIEGKH
jgi:glucokinase